MAGERWVDIAEETAYGTENATADVSLSYLDLDINPDQGKIAELESGYRLKQESLMGPFVGSGKFSIFARPEALGYLLKWALGKVTTTQVGTSTMYEHVFEQDVDNIKSETLTDSREVGTLARRCLGALIKSFTLEAPAREKVTAECDMQYQWEKVVTKPTMGTLESLRPFVFHDASVKLDDASLANVESFRVVLDTSLPDDTHELGSRKLPEIYFEGAEWTVEMDMKFKNWDMRRRFYGATVDGEPTEPQDDERYFDIDIALVGQATGVVDKPNYELDIALPKCYIKENPTPVSRRDRLTQRVVFEALAHSGNKFTLYNKITSY